MPNFPWEKYQKTDSSQGPWSKYAKPAAKPVSAPAEFSVSAQKNPSSPAEGAELWAEKLLGDLKYGTDQTGVGAILKKMGAKGLYSGVPESVGDFMGSPQLGLTRMVKGSAETSQKGKVVKGAKDLAGGAMEAGTIPAYFMAPEAPGAVSKILPSTEKAGKLLQQVEDVAGHVQIDLRGPGEAALKVERMAKAGAQRPKIIGDFLRRVTNPGMPPLTYKEAREFYENATRISFDESNRLTPKAKYLLGQFTKSLDKSLHDAAASQGAGEQYVKAMKAYHSAARFRDFQKVVTKKAIPAAAKGAAAAAGAGAGYKLYEMFK